MLAATECFNVVTARHVILFDRIRHGRVGREQSRRELQARFERLGLHDRGVDIFGLSPDSPEEYVFILDNLHAGPAINARNFHVFRHICEVVQRDSGNGRELLLKNPWDFGNIRRVKALLPGARVIYIHRNPFHILGSLHRLVLIAVTQPSAYLAMLNDRYEEFVRSEFPMRVARLLCDKYPRLLARALIYQVYWLTSGYVRHRMTVPQQDQIEIRYESLCERPEETITAILAHFGLQGRPLDYSRMIGARASRVGPVVASQRDLVLKMLSPYAAAAGYDLHKLAESL